MKICFPFDLGSSCLLVWFLGLKARLIAMRSTAGLFENLGYLLPELGTASLCLLLVVFVRRRPLRWQRCVAAAFLCLAAGLQYFSHAVIAKTGSLFNWGIATTVGQDFDDFAALLWTELLWYDMLGLSLPVIFLLLAVPKPKPCMGILATKGQAILLAATCLVAFGAASVSSGSRPRHPELALPLLRPYFSFAKDTGEIDPSFLLPDPVVLRSAWTSAAPPKERPNFFFIFLESVRASATTPYNPKLPTTPFLASLAQKSLLFEEAHVILPGTSKSLLTTFCGHPPEFRPGFKEAGRLPAKALPALLTRFGYRSAFFEPATEFFEEHRLLFHSLGFDEYHPKESIDPEGKGANYFGLDDEAVVEPILRWMKRQKGPFLAGLLTLNSHHDYKTPASFKKRIYAIDNPPPDAKSFQDYLNAIAYTDSVLEKLVSGMERLGLLENCVLFVMGDHGQGFNEHGRKYHAGCVWEEGTHVPLIVHGPQRLLGKPRRIKGLRQNSDLFATVADLLGIDKSRDYRSPALGMSLLADIPAERKIFMLSHFGDGVSATLVGKDKRIYQPDFDRFDRFDLAGDPGERHDLSANLGQGEREQSIREMRKFVAAVNSWYKIADRAELARMHRKERPSVEKTLNADFGNALRLLGVNAKKKVKLNEYLELELVFEVRGPPPKDKRFILKLYQLFRSSVVKSLRGLDRLPVAQWRPGEWIVLPVQIPFSKKFVEVGKVMIELEFASYDSGVSLAPTTQSGVPLPLRKAALQVLEIQVEAPSRL